MVECNPQVKLQKGASYNVVDIDSIAVGNRTVLGKHPEIYNGQSGCHFANGDTVLARITPCLENGKFAQVRCETQKGFGSTELFVFRGKKDKTDNDYVYYLIAMPFVRKMAANSMTGASGRQRADLEFIKKIEWSFPPLPTQRKIASILSAYDNLIENNNKRIKILEQMAENLYKEWFVRFRFPGHETTPLENGIPKRWSEEKLSAVFEVKYGKDHKNIEDGLIPIFGSGGIMRYGNKALCSEESVLIPRKGSLNNVMYYKGDFWTVDTMFYTKMKIKHCAKYTYFTLSKVDLEGLNSGASIPSMTTDILYHLKMIVPDESTLIAFDKQIDAIFAEKDRLELQNQNLIKQRDLLLPRLMSGKLAV